VHYFLYLVVHPLLDALPLLSPRLVPNHALLQPLQLSLLALHEVVLPLTQGFIEDFQVESFHTLLEVEGVLELAWAEVILALCFINVLLFGQGWWEGDGLGLFLLAFQFGLVVAGDQPFDLLQYLLLVTLPPVLLIDALDDAV
jgi:hypothetical protein